MPALSQFDSFYFIRCEAGPCRAALLSTLELLHKYHPHLARAFFFVEDDEGGGATHSWGGDQANLVLANGNLIDTLATRATASPGLGISAFEAMLASPCHQNAQFHFSAGLIAEDAFGGYRRFIRQLGDDYEPSAEPDAGSCLVTTLYDELNLVRLKEYLACILANLRVFERIAICYESTNGLLGSVLKDLCRIHSISAGRLLLLPIQKRPTFEELFSVQRLFPDGTVLTVANADVVFDATFGKVRHFDLSRTMAVLTRRDVVPGEVGAGLIHHRAGLPNIFSADAWITSTPFVPDFHLDYLLGTTHCDSYINNQIGLSARYSVVNPCFEVKLFHLHDERFNSSAEKRARNADVVRQGFDRERERCGGDPLKGVTWSNIAIADIVPPQLRIHNLKSNILVLDLDTWSPADLGWLTALHYLFMEQAPLLFNTVVLVKMPKPALGATWGPLLSRYQAKFGRHELLLDETPMPSKQEKLPLGARDLHFDDLAAQIIQGDATNWSEWFWATVPGQAGRCHLSGNFPQEMQVRLIEALHSRHPITGASLSEFLASEAEVSE
jgi:hypothetical protein